MGHNSCQKQTNDPIVKAQIRKKKTEREDRKKKKKKKKKKTGVVVTVYTTVGVME